MAIRSLPVSKRNDFKRTLIKKLESYKFQERKKTDPPHKNSGKRYTLADVQNPETTDGLANIIIGNGDMFYNANTANNFKRYFLEYLNL